MTAVSRCFTLPKVVTNWDKGQKQTSQRKQFGAKSQIECLIANLINLSFRDRLLILSTSSLQLTFQKASALSPLLLLWAVANSLCSSVTFSVVRLATPRQIYRVGQCCTSTTCLSRGNEDWSSNVSFLCKFYLWNPASDAVGIQCVNYRSPCTRDVTPTNTLAPDLLFNQFHTGACILDATSKMIPAFCTFAKKIASIFETPVEIFPSRSRICFLKNSFAKTNSLPADLFIVFML